MMDMQISMNLLRQFDSEMRQMLRLTSEWNEFWVLGHIQEKYEGI
jgi:hypothetical protein